jgi:glycine/D-amino acid oxidase-like deaminating enzyme
VLKWRWNELKKYDIVIVGGGIMGSATAYCLMKIAPGMGVAVLEMDRTCSRSSTTLDANAILGEWPEREGLFLANGFSGHGRQQAPAVGGISLN